MGAKQSSHEGNMKDALKFLEDEVKKWDDNIKNLKKSWDTKDTSWVPEYLDQQMDETETRWTNIRTLIELTYKRDKYHDNPTKLRSCCEETTRQIQAQLTQMTKNNYTLVNNLQVAEMNFKDQNKTIEKLQKKISTNDVDLSDPNRPTKLGEVYCELYDNQWTDAFEALKKAGHEEQFAIETLAHTLQHVMQFCKSNAELLLKKSSDALNLLMFGGEKNSENEKVKKEAQVLHKLSMEEIKFQQERWMSKLKDNPRNTQHSTGHTEQVQIKDEAMLIINSKLKQLMKEIATYTVPVVQKAYMEVYWSDSYINGLKPFILECIFISWMMIVQSPPMALHTCETGSRFDNNFYREYMTSGRLVSYMVWPALLLNEGGALVCKGVAEGTKVQTEKK